MDDKQIIELYFERSEEAIGESSKKYGGYCRTIAGNILSSSADVEECVSDTWLRVWGAIPPNRPECLRAFIGRIIRNLALDRLRAAKKRCPIQEELAECLLQRDPTAGMTERVVLTAALDRFLAGLPSRKRKMFLRRYWYFSTVEELARDFGMSESGVKMTLLRLRRELQVQLKQEGIEP